MPHSRVPQRTAVRGAPGAGVGAIGLVVLVILGFRYADFLSTRVAGPAGDLQVEITDAVGVAISRLRARDPAAPIVLQLPRKKDQDIPVAIRTRGHRKASYVVTLRERTGPQRAHEREVAEVSSVLEKPGKYVVQLRPTVTPATLGSSSHYLLKAVLTTGAGKAKRNAQQVIPVTVEWEGTPRLKSGQRPAEIAEIDGIGIPRPDLRDDVTAVSIAPSFCIPLRFRQNVEETSYRIVYQRKVDGKYVTVASVSGTASGRDLHREALEFAVREIGPATVPDGIYRLVLDAVEKRGAEKRKVRDEVALDVTHNWQSFDPFKCARYRQ